LTLPLLIDYLYHEL